MATLINKKSFSGAGHIFDGVLAAAVRGLAQSVALRVASTLADVTNSSGGTPAAGLVLPATFAAFQAGTTDAVAKAEFETALGNVRDAIKEVVAQANVIRAKVPAFSTLVDSMGGTAADGTIGAVDVAMTGTSSGGALVALAGANTAVATLVARLEQAKIYVNKLCTAAGVTELTSALPKVSASGTFAAVSTGTGTAVGGTNALADATVSKAAADAALLVMANNVASLAAKLNAITADANATAALTVVAA